MTKRAWGVLALLVILVALAAALAVGAERLRAASERDALEQRVEALTRENAALAAEAALKTRTLAETEQTLSESRARVSALEGLVDAANDQTASLLSDAAEGQLRRSVEEHHRITEHSRDVEGLPGFRYLLYEPRGLDAAEAHPMIVYLHGIGGCGQDTELLYSENSLPSLLRDGTLAPNALVLMPQCPGDNWHVMRAQVLELIDAVAAEYGADTERISVTGFSLGGIGCFSLLTERPDFFSAAAPFAAAFGMVGRCAGIKTPVRMIHGSLDSGMGMSVVEINETIRRAGGQSELLLYSGEGHTVQHHYADDGGRILDWLISRRAVRG